MRTIGRGLPHVAKATECWFHNEHDRGLSLTRTAVSSIYKWSLVLMTALVGG